MCPLLPLLGNGPPDLVCVVQRSLRPQLPFLAVEVLRDDLRLDVIRERYREPPFCRRGDQVVQDELGEAGVYFDCFDEWQGDLHPPYEGPCVYAQWSFLFIRAFDYSPCAPDSTGLDPLFYGTWAPARGRSCGLFDLQ